jgi:glutamate-ammonia-ligase adenylyltransferase
MRARMRKEQGDKGLWDIKRQPGGLIDAEFILQYLILKSARAVADSQPHALIADLKARAVLAPADADTLEAAIALWSRLQFMIRLTTAGDVAPEALPLGLKQKLARVAGVADDGALERLMADTARKVSDQFERVIAAPARAARATLPPDTVIR